MPSKRPDSNKFLWDNMPPSPLALPSPPEQGFVQFGMRMRRHAFRSLDRHFYWHTPWSPDHLVFSRIVRPTRLRGTVADTHHYRSCAQPRASQPLRLSSGIDATGAFLYSLTFYSRVHQKSQSPVHTPSTRAIRTPYGPQPLRRNLGSSILVWVVLTQFLARAWKRLSNPIIDVIFLVENTSTILPSSFNFDIVPDLFATPSRVSHPWLPGTTAPVSVYENGSINRVKALRIFNAPALSVGLRFIIGTSHRTREAFTHRIEYLAEVRNADFVPLHKP